MEMSRFFFAVRLKLEASTYKRGPSACCHCGKPATKQAMFRDDEAIVLESYCDECIMDPVKFAEILRVHAMIATQL